MAAIWQEIRTGKIVSSGWDVVTGSSVVSLYCPRADLELLDGGGGGGGLPEDYTD